MPCGPKGIEDAKGSHSREESIRDVAGERRGSDSVVHEPVGVDRGSGRHVRAVERDKLSEVDAFRCNHLDGGENGSLVLAVADDMYDLKVWWILEHRANQWGPPYNNLIADIFSECVSVCVYVASVVNLTTGATGRCALLWRVRSEGLGSLEHRANQWGHLTIT
jgi:hypothetical protein